MVQEDIPSIAELEQQLFSHPQSRAQIANMFGSSYYGLVVEESSRLCGYAIVSWGGGDADLLVIALLQQYRGKGVSTRLFNSLLDGLKRVDVERLFLEVRASNASAIGFYRKVGFKEIGNRKNYYPSGKNVREDALIFRIDISSHGNG
ncbi:ribosomal-protein-alanine N-acetyltransferase [Motiliproteus sp. MSK22-1]|nr:ribosomal-protein-alanine N-acetyltransferase [Motiliproteus sp. MSK22-1]